MRTSTGLALAAVLAVGLVVSSGSAVYYYSQYQQAHDSLRQFTNSMSGITYSTSILFDLGNGTRVWHNGTLVPIGWNAYNVTAYLLQGRINATYYPSFHPPSHFVTGILGVQNTKQKFWYLWILNGSSWQPASVGPDGLLVQNHSVYAWTYCGSDPVSFAPSCKP